MSGDIFTDRALFGGAITTVLPSHFQVILFFPGCTRQSSIFEANDLTFTRSSAIIATAVGQMAIFKARQNREAQNIVKVYLANINLKVVETDVLITAYEPLFINTLSESATAVGAGLPVPTAHSGCKPIAELFGTAVSSFNFRCA